MGLLRQPNKTVLDGLIVPYTFKVCVGHIAGVSNSENGSSNVVSVSGLGISLAPTDLKNSAGGEAVRVPTYPVRGPVTITNALRVKDRYWRSELTKLAGYACNKDVVNYSSYVWVYLFDRFKNPVMIIELQNAWISDYKIDDLNVANTGFVMERAQLEFMNMIFHELPDPCPTLADDGTVNSDPYK